MELRVMVAAQHDQIVDRGRPATAPMVAVMAIAPDRWDVAAGVLAMPVADHDRAPQPGRHHSSRPPDIQRLGGGVGDDPVYSGVAEQAAQQGRRDWPGPGQLAGFGAGALLQLSQRHDYRDLGPLASVGRRGTEAEHATADLCQRVSTALPG